MTYRIAPKAAADIDDIAAFIAQDNRRAAEELVIAFMRKFSLLATRPQMGRSRDDIVPGLRQIVIGLYLVFYRIEVDTVVIVRVLHARMSIGKSRFEE